MDLKLLNHQEKYAHGYKDKAFLAHEGGTGKTVCACVWLADGRDSDAVITCPKRVVKKWQAELKKWGTKGLVLSKEDFQKHPFEKQPSALVVDEADEFAAPLFIAKLRSNRAAYMYNFIGKYPDMPVMLLTATPVRSTPWNLHTLLCYVGHYIDWKEWRDHFFMLTKMPFMSRPGYMPVKNWRTLIRVQVEKYCDIVLLRECVGDLPPEIPEKVDVETPEYEMLPDDKPFYGEHRWEQQNKLQHIIDEGKRFRKVMVICLYREQIADLERRLSKDKPTFAIWGDVKDQESVIRQAQEADDCYFIVQASVGAGFDADTFSCAVFASMSYSVRDFVQMKYRLRRVHNLHPVRHAFLLGGRCDKAIYSNIIKGKSFVPSEWKEHAPTT